MNESQTCPYYAELPAGYGLVDGMPTLVRCVLARGHVGQCSHRKLFEHDPAVKKVMVEMVQPIDWVTEQLADPGVRKTLIGLASLIPNGPNRKVTVLRRAHFFDADVSSHIAQVIGNENEDPGDSIDMRDIIPDAANANGRMTGGSRGTFTITVEFEPDPETK